MKPKLHDLSFQYYMVLAKGFFTEFAAKPFSCCCYFLLGISLLFVISFVRCSCSSLNISYQSSGSADCGVVVVDVVVVIVVVVVHFIILDKMSIGTGKIIVLLFSAEMLLRVCR